jgi:hypothetical protein
MTWPNKQGGTIKKQHNNKTSKVTNRALTLPVFGDANIFYDQDDNLIRFKIVANSNILRISGNVVRN